MKKIYLLALIFLLSSGSWARAKEPQCQKDDLGKYERNMQLLKDIESSAANYQDFVDAIKSGEIEFKEVSPSAVANYMEALAEEGMLESIPGDYLDSDEITTSLYVVFEDSFNTNRNKRFYSQYFKPLQKRDLIRDIEDLSADYQDFVDAIKSGEIEFKEVSPSAVANYMEALAEEGMLESIPSDYFDSDQIMNSLYVVLQDPENIADNWDMLEESFLLKRICSSIY